MSAESMTAPALPGSSTLALDERDRLAAELAPVMAAFNDVTARLQATHERLQHEVVRLRAELSDANEQLARSRRLAALGEMAAGIAHEVRNPLNCIGLYAKMLEDDLGDRPGAQQTAVKIARAVKGLDAIVGDVLTFSREIRVRPEVVDVADAVSAALEACTPHVLIPHLRIEQSVLGIEVFADAGMLQQCLMNVIRNAIEAMHETPQRGGQPHRLRLSARFVDDPKSSKPSKGKMTVLSIADSGPGLPRDVVDRIFNPFFTTRAAGTGLGLAIVHRIVDAHGGRIVVQPQDTQAGGLGGAVFELCFPMQTTAGMPPIETNVIQTRGRSSAIDVQEAIA